MNPGDLRWPVVFERATVTGDDYGGGTPVWAEHTHARCAIEFGSGQERREAAQEAGSQTATFKTWRTPKLAQITLTDRISFNGFWDITSIIPVGSSRELHFTAIRSAT